MIEKRILRPHEPLSREERALIQRAVDLKLKSPDFSKLKCEQPLPDVAAALQQNEDDGNAGEIIRSTRIKAFGIP